MLDKSTLQQLSQLKKSIHDSQERYLASVKGTQWRYGFAQLEDGRQILIPPEQMLKVFPGDKVHILVNRDDKKKASAVLEKLHHSELNTFTGQVISKGKNFFVLPDVPNLTRWLFIPPQQLNGAKEGDFVHCCVTRHPFKTEKPQVRINEIIGHCDEPGIEHKYTLHKYRIEESWPDHITEQIEKLCEGVIDCEIPKRQDLGELPFVTIDAEDSLDLDDALHVSHSDSGWVLSVAIADPTAFIEADSELESLIAKRATSHYLPGKTIAMIPPAMAENFCSLLPGKKRLALVCELNINNDGEIITSKFYEATITSRVKLSYDEAARILDNSVTEDFDASIVEQIQQLWSLRGALYKNRKLHNLVMPEKPDYKLILNKQQKIEQIIRIERNDAHRLIEECMLAANRSVAEYLAAHTDSAIYIAHPGFKADKQKTVQQLISKVLPDSPAMDFTSLDAYRMLIKQVDNARLEKPAYSILSKMLERSQIVDKPTPHMGMGLPCYTTFTSPIRKYHDFLVHRIIKAQLGNKPAQMIPPQQLEQLQQDTQQARLAGKQLALWLECQFIASQKNQTKNATITHIFSRGINVQLDDSGISGTIDAKSLNRKYKYDPVLMELQCGDRVFQIDQPLTVKIRGVDMQRKQVQLELPEEEKPD